MAGGDGVTIVGLLRGRPRGRGCATSTGLSMSRWASFNLSTEMVSVLPPMSILNVFEPLSMTRKGPSYERWRGVRWASRQMKTNCAFFSAAGNTVGGTPLVQELA